MNPDTPKSPTASARRAHLLVVDDDDAVRDLLREYLDAQGFRISTAIDAASARAILERELIDLILLDIGLPGEDGLSLTRHLSERWRGAVIILSGRGDALERVIGLEIGADDYLGKPFDLRELLARIRSVLRRTRGTEAAEGPPRQRSFEFEGLQLDTRARRLLDAEQREIPLTTGEFDLLLALVENSNRVLSREQLMQRMHGRDQGPFDRAIDVQISRLRQKIEPDPTHPTLIKSVRSVGYLFTPSVERR